MDENLPCPRVIDLDPRTPDRLDARRGRGLVEVSARHIVAEQPDPLSGAPAQELRGSFIDHPITVSRSTAMTSRSSRLWL